MYTTIFFGVAMFTAVVVALVMVILAARSKLVASGNINIEINGEKTIQVPAGGKLLQTLADADLFLASACGGGGTCAQCKCVVSEGGGTLLPTEESHFTRREANEGWRLSCQTPVKQDLKIEIPEEVFGVKQWECTVESNDNVATFIKELVVELPKGQKLDFRAGGYIQIDVPAYKDLQYKDFEIGEEYRSDWEQFNMFELVANNDEDCFRAYSMASFPLEDDIIMLNIRYCITPAGHRLSARDLLQLCI